jgi:uncharacterized membrane protein YhaH (DUF805 family)
MLSPMPLNITKLIDAFFHTGFTDTDFTDLWWPVLIVAVVGLVLAVALYNVNTRRLHRHPPLVNREEWLLWTAICVFGLLIVESIFHFYLFFVVLTVLIGVPTFVWIAFRRFPPMIEAYNQQLRRARFFSQSRYKHAEATIRTKKAPGTRPKRRRR